MQTKNSDFTTLLYKKIMPKIYGIGAAVVIAGAMFKLLNWPGGALMLGIGLTTEAVIFFLSAFEPEDKEVDWSRVYPQLNEDFSGEFPAQAAAGVNTEGLNEKLDRLLKQAPMDKDTVQRLSESMKYLAESAQTLSHFSESMEKMRDASEEAQAFKAELTKLKEQIAALNNVYGNMLTALKS